MNQTTQKAADAAAGAGLSLGWGGWIISHIAQINGLLQTVLLAASIVATVITARYYSRKTPK